MNGSLLHAITVGALYLILFFSVTAVAVAIERAIVQRKFTERARNLTETVTRCLSRGAVQEGRSACERSQSPLADVFLVGYERLGRVRPALVASAVHRERQRVASELRNRLWVLGTIGALAPFVGLAGTVVGIMGAMDGWEGTTVTFDQIAGPISEALIATAAGIIVAIIAVILFNFFSQRSTRIAQEMKLMTEEFVELLIEPPTEQDGVGDKAKGKGAKGGDKDGSDGDRAAA